MWLQYEHDERHVFGRLGILKTVPTWRSVSDEDMEKARVLREDSYLKANFNGSVALWSCSLCATFDTTWWAMSAHLETT